MSHSHRPKTNIFRLALFVGIAAFIWYSRLDEDHKRGVKNFIRQIPDLPGRYAI